MEVSNMKHSRQESKLRFVSRPLTLMGSVFVAVTCGLSVAAGPAFASPVERTWTADDFAEKKVYSPYAGRAYPDRVYFGDTHLHTKLSPDAGLIGTTLDVGDAYRFARGDKVVSNTGQPVQLVRALDFLVVTDHAEYIGLAPMIRESNPVLLADPYGKWLHERFNAGKEGRFEAFQSIVKDAATGTSRFTSPEITRTIWESFIELADTYNAPGRSDPVICTSHYRSDRRR